MKGKKKDKLKCIKIICHKCGSENIIEVKRTTDSSVPIKCKSCGEKIVVIGEITIVFDD